VRDRVRSARSLILAGYNPGTGSITQLQGRMTQVGPNTLISFDANTSITIVGVAPGAMAANDFSFG
jgi:hypothetical protein